MIFDALRQIANNWLAEVKPFVDAATLLHLPVTSHQVLPRQQDLETMSQVSINFRLPYPITAVEDNASCVVLIDPKPDLKGLDEQRLFIDCMPLHADPQHFNDPAAVQALCDSLEVKLATGVYGISMGMISSPAQRQGSWLAMSQLLWVVTGSLTQQRTTIADFEALPEPVKTAIQTGSTRNAMTAIEEVIAFRRCNNTAMWHESFSAHDDDGKKQIP